MAAPRFHRNSRYVRWCCRCCSPSVVNARLVEDVHNNLLYRWFVGQELNQQVWDRTTFSKNRERLREADVAREFLAQVIRQARRGQLLSNEHFTVDGTLIEAWASHKSFQPKHNKDGKPPEDGEAGRYRRIPWSETPQRYG